MSDAKKCDLCGGYYDYSPFSKDKRPEILNDNECANIKYDIWSINFCRINGDILTKKDLCAECVNKIYKIFYK